MKKFLLLLLSFTCAIIGAQAQTCSVAALRTQADVDNFSTTYPGCKVVNGDLQIVSPTITNLDGLRNVTQITGSLKVNFNPKLISIAGLSSLVQIDGGINIEGNDNLVTLDGLEHLVRLARSIFIINNEKLTSIQGLSGLTKIEKVLLIEGNPALTSLNGLHNLTGAWSVVSIRSNNNLLDLTGLRKLNRIVGSLYLTNNTRLKNLAGLERLNYVGGNLEISGNNSLNSISELAQLEEPSSVSFLNNVIITNNPLLSDCAIKIVCARGDFGNINISGNATGCTSNDEVRYSNACLPQTLVRINSGGPAFTTATQKLFVADQYYAGIDRTSSIASGDILNTTNDVLYRSGRSAASFSYNIPVVNELVNVTLHFAEIYFGAPGKKGGAGSRQFHVNLEGSRKLTNYDIFAEAGGAMRAIQLTIPVRVTDGVLNIDFLTGAADIPRVSAIEVTASPTLIPVADGLVNTGNYRNRNYGSADYLGVRRFLIQEPTYIGDNLTYIKFQLPVGKAEITSAKLRLYTYTDWESVDIHAYGVNNDSWTEETLTGNNAPAASTSSLGSTTVNDVGQYREIDVTSYVNAQRQSGDVLVSFMLDDPNKTSVTAYVNSKESGAQGPQLVYQTTPIVQAQNGIARLGQEDIVLEAQEKQRSTIYPNPVKDQFTVSVSPEHAGPILFEMINTAGKSRTISAVQNAKPGENAEVSISGQSFHPGIYLLKIRSDAFTEVVKVFIAE